MAIPKFVKVVKDSVLYDGDGFFNLYVPDKHFDLKIARYMGEYIELLGVVDYAIEDKNGKLGKLHRFYIPTMFTCKPHDVVKLTSIRLTKNTKPQDYRVLKFTKGDPIIVSTKVPRGVSNMEALVNLFIITGNINPNIPYDQLQNIMIDNAKANGASYDMTMQIWGIVISEICRDPSDHTKSFRTSGIKDMNGYESISVKTISQMDSPFSALSSENFDDSIVRAMLSENESKSPLEGLLTNDFD